ncbi:MAG: hypothetical protein O3B01_15575 [Planctomycetota bacterium]|nr:hypothetical protein [Planctomycetota bacterium]MDA1139995.1 hypothetical protein [Planctomycetota bacterium]
MTFRYLAAGFSLLLFAGCSNLALTREGRDFERTKKVQYEEGWNAATVVLKRYFKIVIPDTRTGQVVALTPPTNTFGTKARQRVVAELIDSGEGVYEIQVRAMNQIDTSSAFKLDEQRFQNYTWKTVGFDEFLETKLVEEIYAEIDGEEKAQISPANAAPNSPARVAPSAGSGSVARPKGRGAEPKAVDSVRGARSHMAFIHRRASIQDDFIRGIILGDMHFKENNFEGAEEQFERAHKKDPSSPVPILARGHARFALGEYQKAANDLKAALITYAKLSSIKMDRRDFYDSPETFYNQLAKLEEFVKSHPDDSIGYFLLGYNYYFSGRPTLAKTALERSLAIDSGDKVSKALLSLLGVDPVI